MTIKKVLVPVLILVVAGFVGASLMNGDSPSGGDELAAAFFCPAVDNCKSDENPITATGGFTANLDDKAGPPVVKGAKTLAIDACKAEVTAAKNKCDTFVGEQRDKCVPTDKCTFKVNNITSTELPCVVKRCTEYDTNNACTYELDSKGNKILPGKCTPKKPGTGVGHQCTAEDGYIRVDTSCRSKSLLGSDEVEAPTLDTNTNTLQGQDSSLEEQQNATQQSFLKRFFNRFR